MGLVCGLSTGVLLETSGLAFIQGKFLFLVTIVGSILVLSDALKNRASLRGLWRYCRSSRSAAIAIDIFPGPDRSVANARRSDIFGSNGKSSKR